MAYNITSGYSVFGPRRKILDINDYITNVSFFCEQAKIKGFTTEISVADGGEVFEQFTDSDVSRAYRNLIKGITNYKDWQRVEDKVYAITGLLLCDKAEEIVLSNQVKKRYLEAGLPIDDGVGPGNSGRTLLNQHINALRQFSAHFHNQDFFAGGVMGARLPADSPLLRSDLPEDHDDPLGGPFVH
ncbi:MAG: hypothetical protein KDI13_02170 [Alphaproteobacteria bacterium]|nr:hypothetical protein [Alphaproteobacteria bacterium]